VRGGSDVPRVLVEPGHQAIDGVGAPVAQRLFLRRIAAVAFAGLGDRVQQAPRGMFLEQEHAPVGNRDLDIGDQHAADLAADVGVELRAVQQHIEQQCDEVDRILVEAIQVQVVPGDAELARVPGHALAKLVSQRAMALARLARDHGGVGHVLLHQRQDRHELAGTELGNGRLLAARLPARIHPTVRLRPAHGCTPALQQAQQVAEHGLVRRAHLGRQLYLAEGGQRIRLGGRGGAL